VKPWCSRLPWTREEKTGYLEVVAGMSAKAKEAIAALWPSVGRLVRKEQMAGGVLP
jgi:hypothetical protein